MSQFMDDMRAERTLSIVGLYMLEYTARFFGMEPDPAFDIPEAHLSAWAHTFLSAPGENKMRDRSLAWIAPYIEEILIAKYPGVDFDEAWDRLVAERFESLPAPPRSMTLAFDRFVTNRVEGLPGSPRSMMLALQGYDANMIEYAEMMARHAGGEPDLSVDIDAERFALFSERSPMGSHRVAALHPDTRKAFRALGREMCQHMERGDLSKREMNARLAKTAGDIIELVTADEQRRGSTVH